MDRWEAEIHVWPHSSGRGQCVDQKEAGDRVRKIEVIADRIDDAIRLVNLYREGIETNPMVWRAVVYGLARKR